ncbi:MAG: hypothetical protein R6X25_06980 [Candidatus Krumholzibacteriia bacterium]
MNRVCCVLATALLIAASPATAQLTVATDAATYTVGDVVTITIANGGPSEAMFISTPWYAITHVEPDTCVFGCIGLPEISYLAAGASEVYSRYTAADGPGHYLIQLAGSSNDPGSILSTTYLLENGTPSAPVTWGEIRRLYR